MMAKSQSLDAKKTAALAALAESSTFSEAAKKAGVSRRSLYSWVRNDIEFSVALKAMQEALVVDSYERAMAQRAHAMDVISQVMDGEDQPGVVRLKAALALVDRADKLEQQVLALAGGHVKANAPIDFDLFAKAPH